MVKYRPHKGSLAEAMAEEREFESEKECCDMNVIVRKAISDYMKKNKDN